MSHSPFFLHPRAREAGDRLLAASYGLFLALYVFAAAAYGLTRETTLGWFSHLGCLTFGLWLAAHALRRTWPSTGRWPWVPAGGLLLFGWVVTLVGWANAQVLASPDSVWGQWLSLDFRVAVGSCNADLSLAAMERTTALLGCMLIAIEIWRHPTWSRALLFTMVLSSFGMVVFFFLQRSVGEPFQLVALDGKTLLAFATYRYHGNAASYLNLFWPVVAGIAIFAAVRQQYGWTLWLLPAVALYAACFINVSKAGNVLAVIGAGLLLLALAPSVLRSLAKHRTRFSARTLLAALLPLAIMGVSLSVAVPWKRWSELSRHVEGGTRESRMAAYRIFIDLLPDAGWLGFGPGTFKAVQNSRIDENSPHFLQTYWVAHQDYLQTVADWGYLGTILWALLFLPACALLVAALFQPLPASADRETYHITLLDRVRSFVRATPGPGHPAFAAGAIVAVALTALHAMVDFPMQIGSLQLYFLVLIALGWSLIPLRRGPAPGSRE